MGCVRGPAQGPQGGSQGCRRGHVGREESRALISRSSEVRRCRKAEGQGWRVGGAKRRQVETKVA